MATIGDLLTVQKNGVVGINNLASSFEAISTNIASLSTNIANLATTSSYLAGKNTSSTVTSSTLVVAGSGRLVGVSIIVAGTTSGLIHNSATTGGASASNALVATPVTIGFYAVGQRFTNGLVIVPGTGQSINVTYSTD